MVFSAFNVTPHSVDYESIEKIDIFCYTCYTIS